MHLLRNRAFTLAELLVVLAVIGFVTMLTTPKISAAYEKQKRTAIVKETTMAIAKAYGVLAVKEGVSASTRFADISRYLATASPKTSGQINSYPGRSDITCGSGGNECYQLSSGAVVSVESAHTFSEELPNASLRLIIDTDGERQTTSGSFLDDYAGAAAGFYLSYDGRLNTVEKPIPSNRMNGSAAGACSNCTPKWLKWMN